MIRLTLQDTPGDSQGQKHFSWVLDSLLLLYVSLEKGAMDEFPEILQAVCSYLNAKGIDCVVVRGVVVMYGGVPWTTADIDGLLDIDNQEIVPFSDLNVLNFEKPWNYGPLLPLQTVTFKAKGESCILMTEYGVFKNIS